MSVCIRCAEATERAAVATVADSECEDDGCWSIDETGALVAWRAEAEGSMGVNDAALAVSVASQQI